MSGFEVLSLACSIFQTISFAHETAVVCIDLYRGLKPPDADVQEMASSMIKAADQVTELYHGNKAVRKDIANISSGCHNNALDKEIAQIADKCRSIATELESEVEKITRLDTGGNLFVTVKARTQSLWKKRKLEKLKESISCCREQMQTLLITQIWTTVKTNCTSKDPSFHNLRQDVQHFILNLQNGFTKIEDLLKQQTTSTQAHITNEFRVTKQDMKNHNEDLMKTHERDAATKAQHERLLKSFKFQQMNARRNNILDPEDATFERIFRSYSNIITCPDSKETKEIDREWQCFVNWLKSHESLFWIQGKPGAGKSTLMKYIASHKQTQKLLDEWYPQTQILSHYIWKIGSPMENNSQGLYCCLIHQIIDESELLMTEILDEFPFARKKTYADDWSHRELESVLNFILKSYANRKPLCIFIDGLDEYCGNGGQNDIVDRIKRLAEFKQVKLCVSSRPEPRLGEGLGTAPTLKVHELTKPEMQSKIHATLTVFERKGQISSQTLNRVTRLLIEKAEGVFLWLQLTMRSIESGIQNKDPERLLISRLKDLPSDIEDLYADMWKRLNQDQRVYRESAATFFQFVIGFQELVATPAKEYPLRRMILLDIGCLIAKNIQHRLLDVGDDVSSEELLGLCEKAEDEIRTRCAGLLEVKLCSWYNSKLNDICHEVCFVHRTAHDFLMNTDAGQHILSYGKLSSMTEIATRVAKGALCRARLEVKFGERENTINPLHTLEWLCGIRSDGESWMGRAGELLAVTERFYGAGFLVSRRGLLQGQFQSCVINYPGLYDVAMPLFQKADASAATAALTRVPWWELDLAAPEESHAPVKTAILQLISCGADFTAVESNPRWFWNGPAPMIAERTTALWNFCESFHLLRPDCVGSQTSQWNFAEVVTSIICRRSPVLEHWGLVAPIEVTKRDTAVATGITKMIHYATAGAVGPVFEVNTSFMLKSVIYSVLERRNPANKTRLHRLHDSLSNSATCIRFIYFNFNKRDGQASWFRVLDQKLLERIIPWQFYPSIEQNDEFCLRSWRETAISLSKNPKVMEPVELEDILRAPAEEGRLGPCRLQDAGFAWSEETERVVKLGAEVAKSRLSVTDENGESSG